MAIWLTRDRARTITRRFDGPASSFLVVAKTKDTAYLLSTRRIKAAIGTRPVSNRKWAWLGIKAQAKHSVWVSDSRRPRRCSKSALSESLRNIGRLSIPRMIYMEKHGDVRAENALHIGTSLTINAYSKIRQIRCPQNFASCHGPWYRRGNYQRYV